MALEKQDRIKQLADSLKGSLDGGVDAIADKIRTAQVFAEEQSDALDQKNQALKGKLADFLTTAKKLEMISMTASMNGCPVGLLRSINRPELV